MFEQVLYLVSQLHIGINVTGQLMALRMQLLAMATDEAYCIVNYIDSVLRWLT